MILKWLTWTDPHGPMALGIAGWTHTVLKWLTWTDPHGPMALGIAGWTHTVCGQHYTQSHLPNRPSRQSLTKNGAVTTVDLKYQAWILSEFH